jgi:methylglyoxal synthase
MAGPPCPWRAGSVHAEDDGVAERYRLALIAHDQMKDDLVAFAVRHEAFLAGCDLVATGTTGGRVAEACPSLSVRRLKSGPLGGDQQIGALIAEAAVDGVIFLVDPLTPMPHDVDVKALMRLAIVYNIPIALNLATAQMLLADARSPRRES